MMYLGGQINPFLSSADPGLPRGWSKCCLTLPGPAAASNYTVPSCAVCRQQPYLKFPQGFASLSFFQLLAWPPLLKSTWRFYRAAPWVCEWETHLELLPITRKGWNGLENLIQLLKLSFLPMAMCKVGAAVLHMLFNMLRKGALSVWANLCPSARGIQLLWELTNFWKLFAVAHG